MSDGWCREDHGPGTPNVHRHPPLPPARPVGGDTREALREEIIAALESWWHDNVNDPIRWSFAPELADRVIATDAVRAALDAQEEAEQRGYERGRRDFQFQPSGDNHHNAALCPYCSPRGTP